MLNQVGIFIEGRWQPSSGQDTQVIVNPTSEEGYAIVANGTEKDVDRAVVSADEALRGAWRFTSLDERCVIVERIAELLTERAAELARIHAESVGHPFHPGKALLGSVQLVDMFLDSARQLELSLVRTDRYGSSLVTRQPVGVVAAIFPWNSPIRAEVKKVIPALLSGCTIVLKPAAETTVSTLVFAQICAEAGVPPGVLNVVPGDAAAGEALVQHPLVRKISFTGSTRTGARIATLAGPSFKRLQLELGGKSAAILLDDVDLSSALPSLARANWAAAGQMCVALSRVLVPRARYDEVVDALASSAQEQVLGDPLDDRTTVGPLVTSRHRDSVLDYINIGTREGARLVVGGGPPAHLTKGWFMEPTVFADVDNGMRIAREEIFGPVVSVIPFDNEAEALRLANDSPYGLHGAVFTEDEAHGLDVARRIESGSVAINGFHLPASAPFGGIKQSGVGREHGPEGYDSFLEYVSYNIPANLADRLKRGIPASGA